MANMVAERGGGNPDGGLGNTGSGENVPVPPGSPNNPGVPGDAPQAMNMGTGTSGYAGPPLNPLDPDYRLPGFGDQEVEGQGRRNRRALFRNHSSPPEGEDDLRRRRQVDREALREMARRVR